MQNFLKEYKIKQLKNDFSYYEIEMLYESLYNKLRMENVFFQVCINMKDSIK